MRALILCMTMLVVQSLKLNLKTAIRNKQEVAPTGLPSMKDFLKIKEGNDKVSHKSAVLDIGGKLFAAMENSTVPELSKS